MSAQETLINSQADHLGHNLRVRIVGTGKKTLVHHILQQFDPRAVNY